MDFEPWSVEVCRVFVKGMYTSITLISCRIINFALRINRYDSHTHFFRISILNDKNVDAVYDPLNDIKMSGYVTRENINKPRHRIAGNTAHQQLNPEAFSDGPHETLNAYNITYNISS